MNFKERKNLLEGKQQVHLLRFLDQLNDDEKQILFSQIDAVDWGFEQAFHNDKKKEDTMIEEIDALHLDKIQADSDELVVIGIGGSYLGARAAIEALRHSFYNSVDKSIRKTPEIYYAGSNISSTYMAHLLQVIGDRDFSINIISKSGTTTEPGIASRIFKKKLVEKYGKEGAAKRIYATTDKAKGALKTLATEEG